MNYNSLMNKPTINYRELIGDNSVTEVGGITEEQFNTLLSTDLSSYYTKAQIDDLFSRSYVYREKSGSIVTFDCPASVNGIDKVVSEIVAVQSGTGDPSPTNVRPISGWSAVNAYRTGKNLVDFADKTITEGAYVINNAPMCLPSGSYVLSFDFSGTTSSSSFRIDDKNGNSIFSTNKAVSEGKNTVSISLSQTGFYVKYYSNAVGEYSNFQIEQGTTATTYEAFSGTTYTTQLKDGQGNPMTCYGGTLSNENGVQSLDNGKDIRLVSECTWQGSNGAFYTSSVVSSIKHGDGRFDHVISSAYKTENVGSITPLSDGAISVDADGYIQIKDSRYSTAGDFKSNMGTTQLIYELATTQQIPQDSLAIATQEGTNNLWVDSGDITVKALDKIIQE